MEKCAAQFQEWEIHVFKAHKIILILQEVRKYHVRQIIPKIKRLRTQRIGKVSKSCN